MENRLVFFCILIMFAQIPSIAQGKKMECASISDEKLSVLLNIELEKRGVSEDYHIVVTRGVLKHFIRGIFKEAIPGYEPIAVFDVDTCKIEKIEWK